MTLFCKNFDTRSIIHRNKKEKNTHFTQMSCCCFTLFKKVTLIKVESFCIVMDCYCLKFQDSELCGATNPSLQTYCLFVGTVDEKNIKKLHV